MRALFLLLVLANLLLFAWSKGYFGNADTGREPQRLAQQLHPEKLKLISGTSATEEASTADVCKSLAGLRLAEGQKLMALLGQQIPGATAKLIRPNVAEAWDITIGPLATRPLAEAKMAELKKLNVTEAKLQANPAGDFSIFLGSDPKKAQAEQRLDGLAKKGIKSARIQQRAAPDDATVQIRGPASRLTQLPTLVRGLANATLTDCPAN